MIAHVKKRHSEVAKRKEEESAELSKLELLHANKVPRLSLKDHTGGAVSTRGTKRVSEETIPDVKELKPEVKPQEQNEEYDEGPTPLFVANLTKLRPAKRWKNNAVVNQKFMMTLDQQCPPKGLEDLNIAATYAIAEATDELIEELKIPEDYWMTLQIGSKEHRREGLTGETWKIPVDDFIQRPAMTQGVLQKLSLVLNSGEFITSNVGFSASVLFS